MARRRPGKLCNCAQPIPGKRLGTMSDNIIHVDGASHQLPAHQNAHRGRHHKAAGPAGRIAQAVEAGHICREIGLHLYLVAVELKLR